MTDTTDISHITRRAILDAALPIAAFEGWTVKTLREAVAACDLPVGAEALYFPDGPLELIGFWASECDAATAQYLAQLDQSQMRIREKVTAGVIARLEVIGKHEAAAKRAASRLLLPDAIGQGPKQIWAAADTIWRAIGDSSTDYNYYTKRTTLSAVISSSMLSWLSDSRADKREARAFVDARIENVMQFEKAKFAVKKRTEGLPNIAEILGSLRYGSPPKRRRRSHFK